MADQSPTITCSTQPPSSQPTAEQLVPTTAPADQAPNLGGDTGVLSLFSGEGVSPMVGGGADLDLSGFDTSGWGDVTTSGGGEGTAGGPLATTTGGGGGSFFDAFAAGDTAPNVANGGSEGGLGGDVFAMNLDTNTTTSTGISGGGDDGLSGMLFGGAPGGSGGGAEVGGGVEDWGWGDSSVPAATSTAASMPVPQQVTDSSAMQPSSSGALPVNVAITPPAATHHGSTPSRSGGTDSPKTAPRPSHQQQQQQDATSPPTGGEVQDPSTIQKVVPPPAAAPGGQSVGAAMQKMQQQQQQQSANAEAGGGKIQQPFGQVAPLSFPTSQQGATATSMVRGLGAPSMVGLGPSAGGSSGGFKNMKEFVLSSKELETLLSSVHDANKNNAADTKSSSISKSVQLGTAAALREAKQRQSQGVECSANVCKGAATTLAALGPQPALGALVVDRPQVPLPHLLPKVVDYLARECEEAEEMLRTLQVGPTTTAGPGSKGKALPVFVPRATTTGGGADGATAHDQPKPTTTTAPDNNNNPKYNRNHNNHPVTTTPIREGGAPVVAANPHKQELVQQPSKSLPEAAAVAAGTDHSPAAATHTVSAATAVCDGAGEGGDDAVPPPLNHSKLLPKTSVDEGSATLAEAEEGDEMPAAATASAAQ